jgi:hypothetical protein
VKVSVLLDPPPGAGLRNATSADPGVLTRYPGTVASALDALETVVASAVDRKKTCPLATKPLPVTVNLNVLLPAAADEGDRDVIAGTGFGDPTLTLTVAALNPPPGGGLYTPIWRVPSPARYDAGIVAYSSVSETYIVAMLCVPMTAEVAGMNSAPTIVI